MTDAVGAGVSRNALLSLLVLVVPGDGCAFNITRHLAYISAGGRFRVGLVALDDIPHAGNSAGPE